jgi:TPR repeat protein
MGYANSQYNLGSMYNDGQGVTQNYKAAIKWYREMNQQEPASPEA